MQRKLYIKCDKCSKTLKFDNYAKRFICYDCNNRIPLSEVNEKNSFIEENISFDETLKHAKMLPIVFTKEDFLTMLKHKLKNKVFAPDSFLKIKKYIAQNVNVINLPLILYECECACYNEEEQDYKIYRIENMIYDEYLKFNREVLNSLYPIDVNMVSNEVLEDNNFNIDYQDVLTSIHEKVQNDFDKKEVIFLEEKIECIVLPIYDCNVKYKNKEYHLSMNSTTGKISLKVPVDNTKMVVILAVFLIVDIFLFIISSMLDLMEQFTFTMAILLFVMELFGLICMYIFTKIYESDDNKNKYHIKTIR